jgi:dTMP kinase
MDHTKLIVFEGIDNCGKTTSIEAVNKYINSETDYKSILVQESKTTFFDNLKKITKFEKHHLFELWATRIRIFESIDFDNNNIILVDRYYDSTAVYQSDLLKIPELYTINYSPKLFRKPDITLFLDIDVNIAIRRNITNDFFEAVSKKEIESRRSKYLKIIEQQKVWRTFELVDTSNLTINAMCEQCIDTIMKYI